MNRLINSNALLQRPSTAAATATLLSTKLMLQVTVTILTIISSGGGRHHSVEASYDDIEITLNGSQYIEKSLLVDPTYKQTNELQIIFKTSISSGLLFYASGTTGDYVVLELIHGKLRYDSFLCDLSCFP